MEYLETRGTPAVLLTSSGDGLVVARDADTAAPLWELRPFPGFTGLVHVAAAEDGAFVVGAGPGGGPHGKGYTTDRDVRWSVYLGNPESRDGIDVAVLTEALVDASPITVIAHPSAPSSPAVVGKVERILAALPDSVERYFADRGQVIYAHNAANITFLREFERYRGNPAYMNVGSLGPTSYGAPIYQQAGPGVGRSAVLHELGHAAISHASNEVELAGRPLERWDYVYQTQVYDDPRFVKTGIDAKNWNESLAQRLADEWQGLPHPNAELVEPFLDRFITSVFVG
jgi:hypothetical protein